MLSEALLGIQAAYPDLERQIDAWNESLRLAGKTWRIKQIGDLEIYPDKKHGFRFIGTRGKVVLSDKEIGTVRWGNFVRGKNKGQAKYGFDLVSWWKSIQTRERMRLDDVLAIIESRLPTEQPALEVRANDVDDHAQLEVAHDARNDNPAGDRTQLNQRMISSKLASTGRLYRQTRQKLTHYWLGIDNPPGWFETAVIVTARLIAKEGLSEDDAVILLRKYAREIPEDARHCSSRLIKGNWLSIDQDIAKAVKNAFGGNCQQGDVDRSDNELTKTIAAWSKYGFRLSDKTTWQQRSESGEANFTINWTNDDRRDITLWLMPALKIKDPELALRVATEIVKLTQIKQTEGKGWGYAYLKKWLPDNFRIKCAKQAKQAAIFKSLRDLRIIRMVSEGKKGRATRWALGSRVLARLDGDHKNFAAIVIKEYVAVNIEEAWELSPWDDLEEKGGEERKGSTSLCSLFNTSKDS